MLQAGLYSVLLIVSATATTRLAAQQPVDRAVCDRLLPSAALTADAGAGFILMSFAELQPEDWQCVYETKTPSPSLLVVRHWRVGADRVRDLFRDQTLKLTIANLPMENIPNVGSVALLASEGQSFLLVLRTDDAIVEVSSTDVGRAQTIAIARRLASTPAATIAEARTALAKVRGQPPKPFEPLPPLPDIVVRRDGKPLECERLLPRAEVVGILGDSYRLVEANDPRPGFSFCEWRRPTDDYTFSFRLHAEPEFAEAKVKGPQGFFDMEIGLSPCQHSPGEPLKGIGEQALLCSSGGSYFSVIVRRAADVLALSCFTCRREQMIALAEAAAR